MLFLGKNFLSFHIYGITSLCWGEVEKRVGAGGRQTPLLLLSL
jgi:hypothetical protein